MRVIGFVKRTIRGLKLPGRGKHQAPVVLPKEDDSLTSRRALLTGGAALAGASALASTDARAAPVYVQLGAKNDTTTVTTIESRAFRAIMGNSTATGGTGLFGYAQSTGAGGMGVQGLALGSNATGVSGTANVGSSAKGVSGTTATGIGVLGTATGNGYGVRGNGGYTGVYGSGNSYGVMGNSSGGYGVYGSGSTGVYASSSGGSGSYGVQAYGGTYGVYASGDSYGVYGAGSTGVYGEGSTGVYGSSGVGSGVYGVSSHPNVAAVFGSGGQYGVQGGNARTAGVRGDSGYVGVWGEGAAWGFYSIATATSGENYGVMSESKSPAGYAGFFKGRVHITSTLSKAAGSFKIDHPLDPNGKWLQHSFVESPDMMNVYNGNVTTDASGFAVVKLPAYFGALNRDFRYQLTVIGTMAQAIVDREIQKNEFRIRTSQGRVKVSWQVTGIRQDDYAKEHPIKVEVRKTRQEIGTRQFLPKGVNGRLMNVRPMNTKSPSDK